MLEYILSFIAIRGVTLDGILNNRNHMKSNLLEREWSELFIFRQTQFIFFHSNITHLFWLDLSAS